MLIAAVGDTSYDIILLLHILAVVVTFAPAAINPLLEKHFERSADSSVLTNWAGFTSFYTSRIALPGLVVILVTGVLMILLSDELWEFSQAWISLAFLGWIAIGGVVSAMILKGEKMLASGDQSGKPLVARGGAIGTVLLVFMLYLMIFKPGL